MSIKIKVTDEMIEAVRDTADASTYTETARAVLDIVERDLNEAMLQTADEYVVRVGSVEIEVEG